MAELGTKNRPLDGDRLVGRALETPWHPNASGRDSIDLSGKRGILTLSVVKECVLGGECWFETL